MEEQDLISVRGFGGMDDDAMTPVGGRVDGSAAGVIYLPRAYRRPRWMITHT